MSKKNKEKHVEPLRKESTVTKEFIYENRGIKINFTLRVDTKDPLIASIEILHQAIADMTAELEKIK